MLARCYTPTVCRATHGRVNGWSNHYFYETGNDSTTDPSAGPRVPQSVDSGQGSLSSSFTTALLGTDSETHSPDTPRNLFTSPIDHGTSATPDDISDHAWGGLNQGGTVTTTGHCYIITYGDNTGDTATDSQDSGLLGDSWVGGPVVQCASNFGHDLWPRTLAP